MPCIKGRAYWKEFSRKAQRMWDREFIGFSALLGRLELLAFQEPVGQGLVCCTLLLLGPACMLGLQPDSEPFTYAASPEVQGPAVTLLIVLMLLALDCYNQAVLKVRAACAETGDDYLTVSRLLEFSTKTAQTSYHHWLNELSSVKWQPRLALLVQLLFHFQLATKGANGCGWSHQLPSLVCSILMAARVILGALKAPYLVQSVASLAAHAVMAVTYATFLAIKDPCFNSIAGGSANQSLFDLATSVIIHNAVAFVLFPVCSRLVPVLTGQVFLAGLSMGMQHLHMNGGYDLSVSDPNLWAVLVTILSSATGCLFAVVVRCRISQANMTRFIGSIKHPDK